MQTSEVEKKNPPAVTPKNKSTLPLTSRKSSKKRDENEEKSEEFNSTTTVFIGHFVIFFNFTRQESVYIPLFFLIGKLQIIELNY